MRTDQVAEVNEVSHEGASRAVIGVVVVPLVREKVVSWVTHPMCVCVCVAKAPTILPSPALVILTQDFTQTNIFAYPQMYARIMDASQVKHHALLAHVPWGKSQ